MKYSKQTLKIAGEILDRWIVCLFYTESECEIELRKLGISFYDANEMMNIVNYNGIKNSYEVIKKDYLERHETVNDYYDPWNDYIKENSGFI